LLHNIQLWSCVWFQASFHYDEKVAEEIMVEHYHQLQSIGYYLSVQSSLSCQMRHGLAGLTHVV
jgi:hypothetical protein